MRVSLIWLVVLGCVHAPGDRPAPTAPAPAPAPAAAPPALDAAGLSRHAARLAETQGFALGGIGVAGNTSAGERLTLQIASEPDAVAMFERLIVHPNRVARLYAYWALKTLAPAIARQHQPALAADLTEIHTMQGCFGAVRTTRQIAAEIDRYPQRAMPAPERDD